MPPRIFTDQTMKLGDTVELPADSSSHLIKVIRCTINDEVTLFNGDGYNYDARITLAGKRAKLHIENRQQGLSPSPIETTLLQGISRGDRMDFSIQKAVELGVDQIQPFTSEKNKIKLSGDRLEKKHKHWHAIMISACEQCGRSDIPYLHPIRSLAELLLEPAPTNAFVLAFGNHPPLTQISQSSTERLSIIVGPESGLSEAEVSAATRNGWHACTLGPRILRTETATVVALSSIQSILGDLGCKSL